MAESSQDPTLRIRGVLDLTDARRELAAFSAEGERGALLVPRAGTSGIPNAGPGGSGVGTAMAVANAISPRRGGVDAAARDAATVADLQFQTELAQARTPEFRLQLLGARRDSLDPGSVARARADLAFAQAETRQRSTSDRQLSSEARAADRADNAFSDALRSLGRQEYAAGAAGRREASRLPGARYPEDEAGGGGIGSVLGTVGARYLAAGALLSTARQFGASVEAQRVAGYAADAADDPLSLTYAQRAQAAARYSNPLLRVANFGDSLGGLVQGPRERELRRLDERARGQAADNANFELGLRNDATEAGLRGFDAGGIVGQQRAGIEVSGRSDASRLQRRISFLEDSNRRNPNGADANRRSNELDQLRRSLDVALEATQNNLRIFDKQQSLSAQGQAVGDLDAGDIASGVSTREASRRSLIRRQNLESAQYRLNNPDLLDAVEARQLGDRQAFEAQADRQDRIANTLNGGRAASARRRAANDPFGAQLASFGAQSQAELDSPNLPDAQRPAVQTRQQAELAALFAQAIRQGYREQVALSGQADVLAAQRDRDPLGARIAGIRANTRQRSLDAESLPDFSGPFGIGGYSPRRIAQRGIASNGAAEEELATRDFNDEINLQRIGSRGRLESSRLRSQGQNTSASANDIYASTYQRSQELANRGAAFADIRNDELGTGVNQLRTLRRRIQFGGIGESVDPGGIGPNPGGDTRADSETNDQALRNIDENIQTLVRLMTGNN